jgi:positive regulator of sigma E activity
MSREVKVKEGLVKDRRDGTVTVAVFDELDCDDCEGTCGSSENSFEVTARDPVGVDRGDRVEVEIEPRSFGKVASIVFGIPAAALMGGLGLGSLLSRLFGSGQNPVFFQGATAGTLFIISLVGLVIYDRRLAARSSDRAEIVELLESNCNIEIDLASSTERSF